MCWGMGVRHAECNPESPKSLTLLSAKAVVLCRHRAPMQPMWGERGGGGGGGEGGAQDWMIQG